MSAQTANTGTPTRVRPAIPYFWWLREVQAQSNVSTLTASRQVAQVPARRTGTAA